jgi:hypothetical protein
MSQILLSFGNKSRNGKDTAADGIKEWCKRHDFPVLHVNFADALKIEVTDAIRAAGSVEDLIAQGPEPGIHFPSWVQPTPNADTEPLSPYGKHVKLLQWWGGDYRRSQDLKYWVDKRREKMVGFGGAVITSDTRYINEAIDTLELGGYNVNVRRLNEDGSQYLDPSRPAGHLSEVELDPWNWDFRIIVKPNEQKLVQMQAVQILKYRMKQEGWIK